MKDHKIRLVSFQDIQKYLLGKNLLESLVISTRFIEEKKEFEFVTDIPFDNDLRKLDNSKSLRKFRLLCFSNIRDIHFKSDIIKQYNLSIEKESHVIQDYKLELNNRNNLFINIYVDSRIGEVSFLFDDLIVKEKVGISKKIGINNYKYFNYYTNEEFDFYRPFPLAPPLGTKK